MNYISNLLLKIDLVKTYSINFGLVTVDLISMRKIKKYKALST